MTLPLDSCPLCSKPFPYAYLEGLDERFGYNYKYRISCSCGIEFTTMTHKDKNGWCKEGTDSLKERATFFWNHGYEIEKPHSEEQGVSK